MSATAPNRDDAPQADDAGEEIFIKTRGTVSATPLDRDDAPQTDGAGEET